ncbi:hypothetical protein A5768_26440 [Mycolicibacterium fortuitum]|nr:hypothetical protein A5768_26440 [Mycolicibacterium fortuitum]
MGCTYRADDTAPAAPGNAQVRQVTLSDPGEDRLQLDVEFVFGVPPEPRVLHTRSGPIDAPGSIHTDFLIHPQHAPNNAVIQVSSPSPSVGQGWQADVSEFDATNPNVLTEVRSAGRILTLVLDLSEQPKVLGSGEFRADIEVVQMVSGQPGSSGEPNLFPVRSPECLWATPPAPTTAARPGTSATLAPPVTPPPTIPAQPTPAERNPTPSDGLTAYLRTKSGQVRCAVSIQSVVCERNSIDGFPQAPASATGGGKWNLASVDSSGAFNWNEGNIGGPDPANDLVLEYGDSHHLRGWRIEASSNGTRFTNIATGKGIFISIENVYPF